MFSSSKIPLLCGIPATGKTKFGEYLEQEEHFAHYDMEKEKMWPRPDLHGLWNSDRASFLSKLKEIHDRIVLNWGFPTQCQSIIENLQTLGVTLVWFDGDIAQARESYRKRGCGSMQAFENQVLAIQSAHYPDALKDVVKINALSREGIFLPHAEIKKQLQKAGILGL